MNFEGRYYTNSGLAMAVHPNSPIPGTVFWGHPLDSDEKILAYWNHEGKAISVIGTVDDVRRYDLDRVVNPQTYLGQMKVKGCKVCEERENACKKNGE